MDLGQIPLFAMLRGKLSHLTERQKLIAENVANSSTPGYQPRDLTPFSFQARLAAQPLAAAPAQTQAAHMPGTLSTRTPAAPHKARKGRDSETTLDGNSVVLEEQMMKMAQARMDYDAAVGFYQKSLGLLKMATRPPGRV